MCFDPFNFSFVVSARHSKIQASCDTSFLSQALLPRYRILCVERLFLTLGRLNNGTSLICSQKIDIVCQSNICVFMNCGGLECMPFSHKTHKKGLAV